MAYEALTAVKEWPESPQYTAAGAVDVALINPNGGDASKLFWVTTNDDTPPIIGPSLGAPLSPGGFMPFQLILGERLWIAAPQLPSGSVPVTLMTTATGA